jgi:hypothetical protein
MKFFTREAQRLLRAKKGEIAWARLCARYAQHLRRIRPHLSKEWRQTAATNFHDTKIFSFLVLNDDDELIINIDMNPRWKSTPLFICSLHFYGVLKADIPGNVLRAWLLNTEVHLTAKPAGEWRVRLQRSELRVQAADVGYFINHEPLA